MRRIHTHDPAGYMLALAGLSFVVGFGFMTYEGARLGDHADPWHHFWFLTGVGFLALGALLVVLSISRYRKAQHEEDAETTTPDTTISIERSTDGQLEEEIVRRFHRTAGSQSD